MNRIGIILFLISGTIFGASINPLPDKIFEIPELNRSESSRDVNKLIQEADSLNSIIGRYPPKYKTEAERDKTFAYWTDLLADAHAIENNGEISLFLLTQLYRQGHNLDVRYAAKKSGEYVQKCIKLYKKSEKCHLEATYLYLQIGPPNINMAKKSLKALKKIYKPNLNEEVEAGYVFVYLYSKDRKGALKQIDKYLEAFPGASRATMFKKFRNSLKHSKIHVKNE